MTELIQIILVNLAVSCDNVGVIALAVRDLPPERARTVRRLGIWLSLALKLVFVAITGYLFTISWLHIHIIGGVLLLYVTWNMLRQGSRQTERKSAGDSFLFALVSIVAADVSMSLDNVLAILSIVSADGQPTGRDLALIVGGLVVCVPVLLWFSGTVSRLMERFSLLTYLCAGYLVYIALRMISQDEMVKLFFQSIHYEFSTPAAVLCGGLVVLASVFTGAAPSSDSARRRRGLVAIYSCVAVYAFIMVGLVSYLSTNPMDDGVRLSVELLYGFTPQGVGAIYTIGHSPFLFTLGASILAGIVMERPGGGKSPRTHYLACLRRSMLGMAVMILLELAITTAGLTVTFGFGSMHPGVYAMLLLLQLLLHCAYISIFCMIRAFVQGRAATVALSMLAVLVETFLVEFREIGERWMFAAGFLPDYYVTNLPGQLAGPWHFLRVVLIALLCIAACTYIGCSRWEKGHSLGSPLFPAAPSPAKG